MTNLAAIIEQRSTAWMQAWVGLDRATLEDCLAADYALIVSAMPEQLIERARWLATCDRYVCTRFRYRGVEVRQLAHNVAVMSAIAEQEACLGDVDRSGEFFVTDIWRLEQDGHWRVCARYSSHPEPAGASSGLLDDPSSGS